MLHSIYDLTTFCRKTGGDVPAKLVGASTTVVGSKVYLFGGRLVTERRMVSDLYVFDLETFTWEKIPELPEDDVPRPRYFHSTDTWNNQLIIFGGMSNKLDSPNPDDLCVLNDVRFFDLSTRRWLPSSLLSVPVADTLVPRARYAHLSSVTADRLFVIGGQDFFNAWLDDVCVYDLLGKAWVQRREYPRHCGTYRSVAVSSNMIVCSPDEATLASQTPSILGPPGTRFRPDKISPNSAEFTPSESLIHTPYSAHPTEEHPSDIFLYSNYNFTDVKRELEVFSPLPDTDFTIEDRSSAMTGNTFPPGLRFPTGAILGSHLIIAGTYLAHSYQSFSIWVLDLLSMTWSRIDPGKAIEAGSWFRGCLWAEANKFLIFGNRNGNLVDDYNRRLLSWDHVAVVDLEAFGIYQPPPLQLDIPMQELGLAALEERVLADFEIVCDDGRKISCSRKLLEDRWPWFKQQLAKFLQNANLKLETLATSTMHVPLPELPGVVSAEESRPDPRLTPRYLYLSESYPITLALLQYFYSLALLTPLQQAPAVLSQLLVLAANYKISHLESLVKHSMHRALSNSTSVGVYEVATLCSARSLQIRALKTVMSYTQKRPSRSRQDRENGHGGRPPDGGAGGRPSTSDGGLPESKYSTRPRGTSDAKWRTIPESGSGFSTKHNHRNNVDGRPRRLLAVVDEDIEPTPPLSRSSTPSCSESEFDQSSDRHFIDFCPPSSPAHISTHACRRASSLSASTSDCIAASSTSFATHSSLVGSNPFHDYYHNYPTSPVRHPPFNEYSRECPHCAIIDDRLADDHDILCRLHVGSQESLRAVVFVPRKSAEPKSRSGPFHVEYSSPSRNRPHPPTRATVPGSNTVNRRTDAKRSGMGRHVSPAYFLLDSKDKQVKARQPDKTSTNSQTNHLFRVKTGNAKGQKDKKAEDFTRMDVFAFVDSHPLNA